MEAKGMFSSATMTWLTVYFNESSGKKADKAQRQAASSSTPRSWREAL
ncbi:hypothetical protein [Rhizobium phaseoli]|nr:hypothetical protein [Rhizobium phaseoli]